MNKFLPQWRSRRNELNAAPLAHELVGRYIGIDPFFKEPIRLTIQEGRIKRFEGGNEAKLLQRFLAVIGEALRRRGLSSSCHTRQRCRGFFRACFDTLPRYMIGVGVRNPGDRAKAVANHAAHA